MTETERHPRGQTLLHRLGSVLVLTATESWPMLKLIFWLTFPVLLALRIAEEFVPVVEIIGAWLEPLMHIVGLPGETALPWAAAILLQPYAGFALLADSWAELELTVAEATIFGLLVLEVHAIIVEARIAHHLCVRMWFAVVSRFACAFAMGALLNQIYLAGGWLQQPADILFIAGDAVTDDSWGAWWVLQAKTWVVIAVIIYSLNLLMRFIRAYHIEAFFIRLLTPLMRLLGINRAAAPTAIIGLVLGLTFGAALMIAEKQSGRLMARDIFLTTAMLGICHSLIEDSLLCLLFGAHLSGVLLFRFVFSCVVIAILARIIDRIPESANRWLIAA